MTPLLLLLLFFFSNLHADTKSTTLKVKQLATGLEIPWQIGFSPGGRLFITERGGRVRIFEKGRLRKKPWLVLEDVAIRGEGGLLGIALHPNFSKTPYVYLAYNYKNKKGRFNRLARYLEVDGKANFDKILLDNIPAGVNHNGGRLRFSPRGYLFWAIGDRYKSSEAQNLQHLTGKILRLTPEGDIPADNPFENSYIYSYGHRNVQGLAFHPITKKLYATEHGPSGSRVCCLDEINLIKKGGNYGWPIIMGGEKAAGMEVPLLHSGRKTTWAPSGAVFLSKPLKRGWENSLFFVGLRSQTLFRLALAPPNYDKPLVLEKYFTGKLGRLREVAVSPFTGKIYLLNNDRGRGRDGLFLVSF